MDKEEETGGLGLGFAWILTGNEEVNRKGRRGRDEERGPRPKARRRTLKKASQAKKKAETPRRLMEEKDQGRQGKRQSTGKRATRRRFPGRIVEAAKRA